MIEEMVAPRPVRGASLVELAREDLDLYAAGELAGRAAADALFSLKG